MLSMLKPEMITRSQQLIVSQKTTLHGPKSRFKDDHNHSLTGSPEREEDEDDRRPSTAKLLRGGQSVQNQSQGQIGSGMKQK